MDIPPLDPAFVRNMREMFPCDAEELLRELDRGEPRLSFRVETRREGWREAAEKYASSPVPWCKDGYYIRPGARPSASSAYFSGAFYIQESAAMAPVEVLDPRPGETVLDICAAPGGKSTQILSRLEGKGALLANEADRSRAQALAGNIERMGYTNAAVTCSSAQDAAKHLKNAFDAVLVDAPCSGEGMFRRDPSSRTEWNSSSPAGCASRQRSILAAAASCLRPGGRLVYSTCTFNTVENEGSVKALLESDKELELEPFDRGYLKSAGGTLRLWPHRDGCEGHFIALFRKKGTSVPQRYGRETPEDLKEELSFLENEAGELPACSFRRVKGGICTYPPLPDLSRLFAVYLGCMAAQEVGKTVRPAHALSRAIQRPKRECVLGEEEALLFMKGYPVPCEGEEGWTLVKCGPYPLGWGKNSQGVLKNHLPKGLRVPDSFAF